MIVQGIWECIERRKHFLMDECVIYDWGLIVIPSEVSPSLSAEDMRGDVFQGSPTTNSTTTPTGLATTLQT